MIIRLFLSKRGMSAATLHLYIAEIEIIPFQQPVLGMNAAAHYYPSIARFPEMCPEYDATVKYGL